MTESEKRIIKAFEDEERVSVEAEIKQMKLDRRSLVYSEVEICADFGCFSFLMPGICDRYNLEENDNYQEFMEEANDTVVSVSVNSYTLGNGESEDPDDEELALIEHYRKMLDEEYGIDFLQSGSFSVDYKADLE